VRQEAVHIFSLAAAVCVMPIVLLDKSLTDSGFYMFQYAMDTCESRKPLSDGVVKAVRLLWLHAEFKAARVCNE